MWFLLCCVILIYTEIEAKFYAENITDFSKCKVHYSRSETSYKTFYEIADEHRENDTLLDFHFSVLAPSDAHILLAPSSNLNKSDPAYEIVLGAGGNKFSDIRRSQKASVKASIRRQDLLSSLDIRSFWIHMSKDGLIEVGRQGEELAFMTWQDPQPIPLKFFSFGSWQGVEVKWFFDCPWEGVPGNSKEVKRKLTDLERLREDLLKYYDPYVRPTLNTVDLTTIAMQMIVHYVSLDEYKSTLDIKGSMKLSWKDEKMVWDPSYYGNISNLRIIGKQIWQPDIVVYNDAGSSMGRDSFGQTLMLVTHEGSVQWTPPFHMTVWCDASELGHWPIDEHLCEIIMGFWVDFYYLKLQFNIADSQVLGNNFQTEWDVVKVTAVSRAGWNNTETPLYSNSYDAPYLKLSFKLKRNSNVYSAVFFAPFLVVGIAMLATFCVSPHGYLKISLCCLQLLIISIVLVNLAGFIPAHPVKVPYLLSIYYFSCFGSVVCLIISIIVINLSRLPYKNQIPHYLWNVFTSRPVQKILFLPEVQASEAYGKLDDADVLRNDENAKNSWILLGKVIDRFGFLIYLILIIFAVSVSY